MGTVNSSWTARQALPWSIGVLWTVAGIAMATAAPVGEHGQVCDPTTRVVTVAAVAAAQDRQVGAPGVCYWNPEFSPDGKYMVWFDLDRAEGGTSRRLGRIRGPTQLRGRMWHCAVDPGTGELSPPDCKGFGAFQTTLFGRANFGIDARGSYYVGSDLGGRLVMVRPTGARTGDMTVLAAAPDTERRGIYPSRLPGSDQGYVYWIKSLGGMAPGQAREVELRFIDLAAPAKETLLARQPRPRIGWAPLDVGFPRWFSGTTTLVFGVQDEPGRVQMHMVDVSRGRPTPVKITDDPHHKVDAFPFTYGGRRYLIAGIDRTATSQLYAETPGGRFEPVETINPPSSTLRDPCLAQSHEPFEFGGKLYTAYQVSDCAAGRNFFSAPAEVWVSTLLTSPPQHWRLSPGGNMVNNEPEPLVGSSRAWVVYSAYRAGQNLLEACPQLMRAALRP